MWGGHTIRARGRLRALGRHGRDMALWGSTMNSGFDLGSKVKNSRGTGDARGDIQGFGTIAIPTVAVEARKERRRVVVRGKGERLSGKSSTEYATHGN